MTLQFNTTVKQQIQSLQKELPQALLLTGELGSGLSTTAQYIAESSVGSIVRPTDTKGKPDENGLIRIEQIRELQIDTRTSSHAYSVHIIDDADKMTTQAQNALLKLLEEPNSSTKIVLTSHYPNVLLPTIRSRLQTIHISPISREASALMLEKYTKLDDKEKTQILFLATGRPALITRLAENSAELIRISHIISDAKDFVANSVSKQTAVINKTKDRAAALELISYCILLLQTALRHKTTSDLIEKLDTYLQCYERIAANGNIKLQLTACVV